MRSIISKFWWSGSDDKRKIAWVSWKKICKAKKDGGLGFCNLRAFNLAMLAKQAWRFIQSPQSLCARVYKAKYFPNVDFLHACSRHGSSYAWNSIMEGRKLLDSGIAWRIGNGQSVNVREDNWITTARYMKPLSHFDSPADCKVSYFIDDNSATWDIDKLAATLSP
ncbi:uncharacterized mitochondrial protein AtMg00310-like [Mercurialis annua]|uniref:uncharacterized mitochondrial protein AtMg00310-like n=1 Tax=Mercurialis annua TaxID=3986 RepID=UPI00215FA152|nr:uncharacterized mitochondrial protein AtMg00310-like [Mercurialis annua]